MKLSGAFEDYVWTLPPDRLAVLWDGYLVFREGNGLPAGPWDDAIAEIGVEQIRAFNLVMLFNAVTLRYAVLWQEGQEL